MNRKRPAAQEGAADVCRTATCASDDPARRAPERTSTPVENPRRREDAERLVGALDVELEAGRPVECSAAVGADLGADLDIAEETESAPRRSPTREIEVERPHSFPAKVQVAS